MIASARGSGEEIVSQGLKTTPVPAANAPENQISFAETRIFWPETLAAFEENSIYVAANPTCCRINGNSFEETRAAFEENSISFEETPAAFEENGISFEENSAEFEENSTNGAEKLCF